MAAGPMPDTWSKAGEMMAPAARMTSLLQDTFRRGDSADVVYWLVNPISWFVPRALTSTPYARMIFPNGGAAKFEVRSDSSRMRVTVCWTARCKFGRCSTGSKYALLLSALDWFPAEMLAGTIMAPAATPAFGSGRRGKPNSLRPRMKFAGSG